MVADRIIFLGRCVNDSSVLMSKPREIYAVFLGVKSFQRSRQGLVAVKARQCKWNLLASLATIQTERFVLGCGQDLVTTIIEACSANMSLLRLSWTASV